MAKTPKLKSKPSLSNPRSRASKRATSPSIDLDKSLKTLPRNDELPQQQKQQSSILSARPGAGVTKKKSSKRGNAKTRVQKVRQERGLQRAEAVMDQMQKKVEEARDREGKRRERRKVWDEVNSGIGEVDKPAKLPVAVGVVDEGKGEDWEDVEDVEDVDVDGEGDGDDEMGDGDKAAVSNESAVLATESTAPVVVAGENIVVMDDTASSNGAVVEDELDKVT